MHKENLIKELHFKAVRSSGAGGQHVNKVSSKIELTFDVLNSQHLSLNQKETLQEKLANRINKEGVLLLFCDESRSQHKNKELAIKRFIEIIFDALKRQKIRRPTKPSRSSIQRNTDNKKKNSAKKTLRRKPGLE
ncbi:MAG: aminoacyl-tRNA hydrolase [Flavobacteriaceae bacterium]|nr:aminoacyl-tRNA hydrolase [Flavobacteriaceae bacterium]